MLTDDELKAMRERCATWDDADFVRHARTDMPRLLAEVERLRVENGWLWRVRDAAAKLVARWEPEYPQVYEPKGPMIDDLKADLRAAEGGG